MQNQPTEEKIVGKAQAVLHPELDTVEKGVDRTIESTKGAGDDLTVESQEIIDQGFNRLRAVWERQRPKVEQYIASHPWIVIGSCLFIGYLIGGPKRSRRLQKR